MGNGVQAVFEGKGLQRIGDLERFKDSGSYLVDARNADQQGEFLVYPRRDGHFRVVGERQRDKGTGDLYGLDFYGTHWMYGVDNGDWQKIRKQGLDESEVLAAIKEDRRAKTTPPYFRRGEILGGGFWMFVPETEGWKYFSSVLVPRFHRDVREYKNAKHSLGGERETRTEPAAGRLTE